MTVEITPKWGFVLAEWIDFATLTGSKILIPGDDQNERGGVFKVLKVGPGRFTSGGERIPIDLEVGDEVIVFNTQNMVALNPTSMYGGKKLALINADFIVASVKRAGTPDYVSDVVIPQLNIAPRGNGRGVKVN